MKKSPRGLLARLTDEQKRKVLAHQGYDAHGEPPPVQAAGGECEKAGSAMTEYCYKVCPICGIHYAVDKVVMDHKREASETSDNRGWYCPNGHSLIFTVSEATKLRRERDLLKQQIAQKDDEIADERRRTEAETKKVKRLERRAKNGTCPCGIHIDELRPEENDA